MHDNLLQYAAKHQLKIEQSLGFGIHGSVFLVSGRKRGVTAVKHCLEGEPFEREFEVYARLDELGISEVHGFNVPQLLYVDEDLRILEMSVVVRPFILDFGGAYLDVKPAFTSEIWEEWEAKRREEYGERWPLVRKILDAFEAMDIYIVDVHPSNIAFRD